MYEHTSRDPLFPPPKSPVPSLLTGAIAEDIRILTRWVSAVDTPAATSVVLPRTVCTITGPKRRSVLETGVARPLRSSVPWSQQDSDEPYLMTGVRQLGNTTLTYHGLRPTCSSLTGPRVQLPQQVHP